MRNRRIGSALTLGVLVAMAAMYGSGSDVRADAGYERGRPESVERPSRFEFRSASSQAKISESDAVNAVRNAGHLPDEVRPVVALGTFTDTEYGQDIGDRFRPQFAERLAYIVSFRAPGGPPAGGGAGRPERAPVDSRDCKHAFVVDANTGEYLEGVVDCSHET